MRLGELEVGIGTIHTQKGFIDGAPCCTSADPRFFSHRAEAGQTGRHLSGIIGGESPVVDEKEQIGSNRA